MDSSSVMDDSVRESLDLSHQSLIKVQTRKSILKKPSLKLKNALGRFTQVRDGREEEEAGFHDKSQDFSQVSEKLEKSQIQADDIATNKTKGNSRSNLYALSK